MLKYRGDCKTCGRMNIDLFNDGQCLICKRLEEIEKEIAKGGVMEEILTVTYDKEAGAYVGKCQLPPIYSQGPTKQQALEATESAVKLFIRTFFKNRETCDLLKICKKTVECLKAGNLGQDKALIEKMEQAIAKVELI